MTQEPSRTHSTQARDTRQAVSVVSAYGAFRLLLLLLAGWSAFAGFALITGFAALSYEGGTASRVAGSYMMVLAPIYALIALRRDEYRLLLWVPYAALLAVILPGLWQLVFDQKVDAPLILVVSIVFLALLVYMWVSSHPLDFFDIVRKDHDVAVKLMWAFLGVLTERLRSTSRDLGAAREQITSLMASQLDAADLEEV